MADADETIEAHGGENKRRENLAEILQKRVQLANIFSENPKPEQLKEVPKKVFRVEKVFRAEKPLRSLAARASCST